MSRFDPSSHTGLSRRNAILTMGAGALVAGCNAPAPSAGAGGVLRIGFQKNGVLLVAKTRGSFEPALKSAGVTSIEWLEFPSGPPLLEALAVGSVDVGTTGDTPPIFAQVAGAPLRYVAQTRLSGLAGGVIVPKTSNAKSIADLKGKKLCFTRGSSAHNSAVLALESGGLTLNDVESINLGPADAAAAFAQGGLDAWVIWDPFFTIAVRQQGARTLIGLDALGGGQAFTLANARFVDAQPERLKALLSAMAREGEWCAANTDEVADITAKASGLELELLKDTMTRTDFKVEPLSDDVLAAQQASVDRFVELKVIPKSVKIADAAWRGWTG